MKRHRFTQGDLHAVRTGEARHCYAVGYVSVTPESPGFAHFTCWYVGTDDNEWDKQIRRCLECYPRRVLSIVTDLEGEITAAGTWKRHNDGGPVPHGAFGTWFVEPLATLIASLVSAFKGGQLVLPVCYSFPLPLMEKPCEQS